MKKLLAKLKEKKLKKQKMLQAQRYYKLLKAGVALIQFIQRDMEEMKKNNMNRQQRRRWEKELYHKGQFSPEIIGYYAQKVDMIIHKVESQLNPPKVKKIKAKKQVKPEIKDENVK